MLTKGKLMGVKYHDSLFRGIEVDGGVQDKAQDDFNHAMVGAQIGNILRKSGISLGDGEQYTLTVDPYSYNISVSGVDDLTARKMEAALNAGDNGKELLFHLQQHYTRDWRPDNGQFTKANSDKYQAYHQVYDLTGLKLDELSAHDGTFWTQDGQDVREIASDAIDASARIPSSMSDWVSRLVGDLAAKGWENVADMTLTIGYGNGGLSQ